MQKTWCEEFINAGARFSDFIAFSRIATRRTSLFLFDDVQSLDQKTRPDYITVYLTPEVTYLARQTDNL